MKIEMERIDLFLLWNCACFNALDNYWNDYGRLWNHSFIWIIFPYALVIPSSSGIGDMNSFQVPIIGKYVDGIPYLKDFAASAAKQAPKYPAVQVTNIFIQFHLLIHVSVFYTLFILHVQDDTECDGLRLCNAQRERFLISIH